uniref:SFRICE_028394 n=1 Tax=Spodoptera frugiperda TaxID=7108 RepID=A0A2H1WKL8_SPOFR
MPLYNVHLLFTSCVISPIPRLGKRSASVVVCQLGGVTISARNRITAMHRTASHQYANSEDKSYITNKLNNGLVKRKELRPSLRLRLTASKLATCSNFVLEESFDEFSPAWVKREGVSDFY